MKIYSREDLERLTYGELHRLEDELLSEYEVAGSWRIRASAGRMVYFVLTGFFWFTYFWSGDALIPRSEAKGLIQFVWFFISLILSGLSTTLLWKVIGMKTRQFLRLSLHYWPVTLGFFAWVSSLSH